MYRSRWPQVLACLSTAILSSLILLPVPLIYQRIIDVLIPQKNVKGIFILGLVGLFLYLIHLVTNVGQRYLTLKTTKAVIYELRARVCTKLQELCLSFYDNTSVGKLHARAMLDTEQVDVSSNAVVSQLLVSIVLATFALIMLLRINLILTGIFLCISPLMYILRRLMVGKLKIENREFRNQREHLSSNINQLLHSIRLIKTLGTEKYEQEKINDSIHEYLQSGIRLNVSSSILVNSLMALANLGGFSVYIFGGWLVLKGQMSIGSVVAFAQLQTFLINPINQLASITEVIFGGNAALGAVFELLDVDDVEFPALGQPLRDVVGEVSFRDVSFAYPDGTDALVNVSFTAKPGHQIALVGSSGSGKSTLINLILGLYQPDRGQVLIDNHDLKDLKLRNLRRQMGIVSQETILIDGTIKDNIRYGSPRATDQDIEEAARKANAHDFIMQLPHGYDSPCGDGGVRLSGGQRQRLAIARALLRNPKILILDEATSALDSQSELLVQTALDRLRRERTTFVVAHRLSTILNSDLILVMKKGEIIERGTHNELLALNGVYARLYKTQFKSALGNAASKQVGVSQP
jgi:ABC-type multidrug transport system fused ATPase/permease subunit